jgi:hypothetical protein
MAIIKLYDIQTTQVADGHGPVYGFTINNFSETSQLDIRDNTEIDTAELNEEELATVNAFILLVETKLAGGGAP